MVVLPSNNVLVLVDDLIWFVHHVHSIWMHMVDVVSDFTCFKYDTEVSQESILGICLPFHGCGALHPFPAFAANGTISKNQIRLVCDWKLPSKQIPASWRCWLLGCSSEWPSSDLSTVIGLQLYSASMVWVKLTPSQPPNLTMMLSHRFSDLSMSAYLAWCCIKLYPRLHQFYIRLSCSIPMWWLYIPWYGGFLKWGYP